MSTMTEKQPAKPTADRGPSGAEPSSVLVSWTTRPTPTPLPPQDAPMTAWKVTVYQGETEAASMIVTDRTARSAALELPEGQGYRAEVALCSEDGAVTYGAISAPVLVNVGAHKPAKPAPPVVPADEIPVAVTVSGAHVTA